MCSMMAEVVGAVVLVPEPGTMLLDNVAVDPASQGKGYGRFC
ncbi:GNAT family N-acetyltransferase [Microvirga arabica]